MGAHISFCPGAFICGIHFDRGLDRVSFIRVLQIFFGQLNKFRVDHVMEVKDLFSHIRVCIESLPDPFRNGIIPCFTVSQDFFTGHIIQICGYLFYFVVITVREHVIIRIGSCQIQSTNP